MYHLVAIVQGGPADPAYMPDQSFVSFSNFFKKENPQSALLLLRITLVSMSALREYTTEHSQSLCQQFCPSSSFKFPKRTFGAKGATRSFQLEWCQNYMWLHYDVNKDAPFAS